MDKKNKIFFIVVFLLLIGSVGATYWRIMIKKDYMIEAQVDCDPETEACFVWECDPESIEEGEACTGDPESDIWYYKIVRKNASNIPLCDPQTDENCNPLICEEGEEECEEVLCDEETKLEQEVECNDPVQYLLNNPVEEDEEEEDAEDIEDEIDEATDEADLVSDAMDVSIEDEEVSAGEMQENNEEAKSEGL